MDNQTVFVAYLLANIGFAAICSLLAGLSFHAYYRRPGQISYPFAGLGFSCIGLGGVVGAVYMIIVETDFLLSSSEFLILKASEDVIFAVGLGLLFLAITKHRPMSSNSENRTALGDEENYWKTETPFDD